ncbi:hypothetical protein B7O87_14140 [Cylindrospermopsis raciborskii CENA303]|uniref:Uncharacterized protein n=1 Tax=Cylindrospermopsis raciborskii CENA303 TaxID=1170769 RepID=A0A1X4G3T8_9CYAN|nr:hypothetical protein B7O87_14140 [Cylindrospermopsis raciborskii CENA303]
MYCLSNYIVFKVRVCLGVAVSCVSLSHLFNIANLFENVNYFFHFFSKKFFAKILGAESFTGQAFEPRVTC